MDDGPWGPLRRYGWHRLMVSAAVALRLSRYGEWIGRLTIARTKAAALFDCWLGFGGLARVPDLAGQEFDVLVDALNVFSEL